ncbi:MAG: beta strand repeat-containing protein [Terracidiphilus sp.]
MPSSRLACLRIAALRRNLNLIAVFGAALLFSAGGLTAGAQTPALVWYITTSSTTSQTGVYTVDVDGSAAATNPTDVNSSPSVSFLQLEGLAIDPSAGHYFATNLASGGTYGNTSEIIEGNTNGTGTPSVIYTSGNSGGDAIEGLAFDPQNSLLYFAVTDVNVPSPNTDTGIYTISALGTGTRTATELVNLSSAANSPTDIAIDTTNNLLFYTNGFPGLTNVEEVGVANLTTGEIINGDLVSYSTSGTVYPYGIAVDPATDTLYWTTVNFSANSGNTIYSAKYSTGMSVTLSDNQTLATTTLSQVPVGISLDVPSGGYYVDTSTGVPNDTTANEILFGSSLIGPATLTDAYNVPDQDGGTETLPTEGIVVEVQPVVDASGTVTFIRGDGAIEIDSGATVSDADGYYPTSATVSIASGFGTGDTLSFTNQNGITGSFSSGTLTLTGAASAVDYEAALDSVTFSTTSTSTTARTLDWTVSDGIVGSATTSSTVDVHIAPTVTAGATATFDGGGSPVALDPGLTVSDVSSSTLVSATVSIASGFGTGDTLSFTNQNGITGSFSASVLTLTGTASVADYQAALESVTFSTTSTSATPRTIDWTVSDGVVSSETATSTVDVLLPPAVTSASSTTFTVGSSGSFTVTASGNPAPTFSETGVLPAGVTFSSAGLLSGTPAAGTGGTYPIVITASNGVGSNATQSFTLTIDQPPAITSSSSATFPVGSAGSFTVTASGYPAPTFSETGALPSGVSLSSSGVLSGTPAAGTGGTYPLTITASNGVSPNATQNFTLSVNQAPAITSASSTTFQVGQSGSFTASANGYPFSTFTETGALPSGVTFVDQGNNTAIFSGTPVLGADGTYPITIMASNGISPNATQSFTLTVDPPDSLVVNTAADDSGTASNCTPNPTTTGPGNCSLRDALLEAASLGAGSITFDPTAFASAQTITLMNGTLTIAPNTAIAGGGLATVSGNSATIIFLVNSGTTASLSGLTISNGSSSSGEGGGGISNNGALTVSNSTISGNSATSGNGGYSYGGGIYNAGTLTLSNSTISGNSAISGNGGYSYGGGIDSENGTALTLTNSTISGNSAGSYGGGINSGGTSTAANDTIAGNFAGTGGAGIYNFGGSLSLGNSVVSGNQLGTQASPGNYDDLDDTTGNTTFTAGNNGGNVVGYYNAPSATPPASSGLAPLGNYGGPTQTMLPQPGSAAICGGLAANIPNGVTTDQRGDPNSNANYPGYTAPNPACVDSGAVQSNYGLGFTTQPPADAYVGTAIAPAPVVTLTESGDLAGAATGTVTMADTASLLGGTTTAGLSSGAATFSNLVISNGTIDDQLTASLILNPNLSPQLILASLPSTGVSLTTSTIAALISPVAGSVLTPPARRSPGPPLRGPPGTTSGWERHRAQTISSPPARSQPPPPRLPICPPTARPYMRRCIPTTALSWLLTSTLPLTPLRRRPRQRSPLPPRARCCPAPR